MTYLPRDEVAQVLEVTSLLQAALGPVLVVRRDAVVSASLQVQRD